ncbi:MAG: sigma-E processing peptidase SpoIIGA [Bacilli bacterium]|nr:sigma-E processing peptidase SpoIIGA [Bacilli bacterium]
MMIVYVDLIFFMNFAIDGALLLATAWTQKIKVKGWRVVAGAGIGAAYVIFMLFPQMSFLFTFLVKFGFSILMLCSTFGFGRFKRFARILGAFYLVNFVAAGGILGIHYFLLSSNDVMNGIWFTHSGGLAFGLQVGLGFVFLVLLGTLWFYVRMSRMSLKREEVLTWITDVTVYVDSHIFTCKGLIDTGNRLYDPLTQMPVMVVEAETWKAYLPEAWLKCIQQSEVEQIFVHLDHVDFQGQERLRLIPFRGINKSGQFMLAIKPDQVVVQFNDRQMTTSKVLVGFDGGRLSSDNAYQAILHPALIETNE